MMEISDVKKEKIMKPIKIKQKTLKDTTHDKNLNSIKAGKKKKNPLNPELFTSNFSPQTSHF
jgi:hypothetical protein